MTSQQVLDYVKQFIQSVGVDPASCWNEQTKAYYIFKGSAKLEIFVSAHTQNDGSVRNFLRVFCPVYQTPATDREKFYRRLLELNDQSLGVKLTIMPNSDWIYATYERDIEGIDYNEVVTCITDMGLWSDYFDDQLKTEFGGTVQNPSQPK